MLVQGLVWSLECVPKYVGPIVQSLTNARHEGARLCSLHAFALPWRRIFDTRILLRPDRESEILLFIGVYYPWKSLPGGVLGHRGRCWDLWCGDGVREW